MIGRRGLGLVLVMTIACLAGCRTLPPQPVPDPVANVDVALVPPASGATRMQLDSSQAFLFPQLLASELPEYPVELLALRLPPLELCVDVDIDEAGAVRQVARRIDIGCPMAAGVHEARFAAALEHAVSRWQFDPGLVCRTPDGRPAADACAERDVVETPVALRMSYVVVFSQQDGHAKVEVGTGRR